MAVSRRQFLRSTGLAAAFLGLPAWLGACARDTGVRAAHATAAALAPDAWAEQPAGPHPEIAHLLGRITFGPRPGEIERAAGLGWEAFLEQQLHPEQIDDGALERRLERYPTLRMSSGELLDAYPRGGGPAPLRIVQELEQASLLRAVASERQLLEVMVDFWSSHLSIYIGKGQVRWLKTADDREVIRAHALGRFSDMLLASARSPAMLVYLDNAQNVAPAAGAKGRRLGINENYARELLELHTVGVDGGYTQDDVVALAHVLTGWTVARGGGAARGSFVFAPRLHDSGAKRIPFLDLDLPAGGGAEEGETVLRRLAEHPRTARRLAAKLAAAFVSDSPPPALVQRVAQTFLDSGTDIRATLGALLRSDEFRAAAGQKVKLPLRMLVSAARALGAQVEEPQALARQLRGLGQPFFGWPAPDGYPQAGAAWVNTGGMLARWNLAFALAEGRVRGVTADLQRFAGADPAALVDAVGAGLLGAPLPAPARAALLDFARGRPAALSGVVGLVLASPAFQIH
jgi:hypothetical protein